MQTPTVSVVIPAYARTRNLCQTVAHLAKQEYARDQYIVVIAALRLPEEEVDQVRKAAAGMRITIVDVPGILWNVSRARNTGIAAGTGDIIVLLDADIIVSPAFLREHVDCHSSNACAVAGAVESFTPYVETPTEVDLASPPGICQTNARHERVLDARWDIIDKGAREISYVNRAAFTPHAIRGECIPLPWAFFWSGNVSISRHFLESHNLFFDESFEGWGAEDMEWGFRVWQAGAEMFFCRHASGVHLPHKRSIAENVASEQANLRRLLRKHPCLSAEIVVRYNDIEGNRRFNEICSWVQRVFGQPTKHAGCFMAFTSHGSATSATLGIDTKEARGYDCRDLHPVLGIATWFRDRELEEVRISNRLRQLPLWLWEEVLREAHRVGKRLVLLKAD